MKKLLKQNFENIKLDRLLDANANRLKEGLRVLEDITRFIIDDSRLTGQFKKIRHAVTACLKSNKLTAPARIIKKRQIQTDVGKKTIVSELERKNIADIFLANCQRVKESIRVLEECMKLFDRKTAQRFKSMRYSIYHLEKRSIEKIVKICNNI
ncbi:MAG: thiamine-phosphate pyrophosphorylase [Candidatus Omnitrophota bacterium]